MALVLGFASQSVAVAANAKRVVNIYNWADYIGTDVIKNFQKETGITVVYDTYDSIAAVAAKLSTGSSGYDVVNTDNITARMMINIGQFVELDRSKLPNWKNIDPDIMKFMAINDPGNKFVVPFFHGSYGIIYNEDLIKKIDPNAPIGSSKLILDPENAKKFAKCGINLVDSPAELYATALKHSGKVGNYSSEADIKAAEALWMKVRPSIRKFDSADYINGLANSELCMSTAYSGDYLVAMDRAKKSGVSVNLKFFIPSEGGMLWLDGWAIPKGAEHVEEALAWLNYLMDPKVAAANTNTVKYPNAIPSSKPMIDKALVNTPSVYLSKEALNKLEPFALVPIALQKIETKSFNRLKSGR